MALTPTEIIARKRDGGTHSRDELRSVVAGLADGTWADYQVSAWLMAALLKGLSRDETAELTRAYVDSGSRISFPDHVTPRVDKHSTGGVGDKVSLILAPMIACCGGYVPMCSGRGLGHTGGTLDKLEAMTGYRTVMPREEFVDIVARV